MASTYLALNVHIVFATKGRVPMIADDWRGELHAYIGGTLRGLGVAPQIVGGVADHVHLLAGLRGTHAVGEIVREVKKATNSWARERSPGFAWQEGYGAFSVSPAEVGKVVAYIANQEEHHRRLSSADELRSLLAEYGVECDERYFESSATLSGSNGVSSGNPRVVDPRLRSATPSGSGDCGVEGRGEARARGSDGGQVGECQRERGRVGRADGVEVVEGGVELAVVGDFGDERHLFVPPWPASSAAPNQSEPTWTNPNAILLNLAYS